MEKPVALVTGAGSGIGLATSKAFLSKGYRVVMWDLPKSSIDAISKEFPADDVLVVKADVTSSAQVQAAFEELQTKWGRLDAAVNCAGIDGGMKLFLQSTDEEFDQTLNVNLRGTMLCLRQELKMMYAAKKGAIVNIGSVYGLVGAAGGTAYVASKHAVVGLTKSLALEFATRGVRINAVCPGAVQTPLLENVLTSETAKQFMQRMHPMGRVGTPEEVANTIVWLCSSEASFITGSAVSVDGGYTSF